MYRLCLGLTAILLSIHGFGQNRLNVILKQKEIRTEYYDMIGAGSKVLYLPMDYGRSVFTSQQQSAINNLLNANVAQVDLVYSDYPANADFSLLTQKRLAALQKLLPQLFTDGSITFRKVRQTIGKTKQTAASLEHGFFIYFRPRPTKESAKKEMDELKKALHPDDTMSTAGDISDTTHTDSIPFWCWQTIVTVDTASLPPLAKGATRTIRRISITDAVANRSIAKESDKEFRAWGDSAYFVEDRRDADCASTDGSFFVYDAIDTTVTQVFNRHNWTHALVVADVTGSMSPYSEQLLKWLKLNLTGKRNSCFLFFNDGDEKPDEEKRIGKTGGLYPVCTNKYDEVEATIFKAMRNGSGGDAPENNIEALLESDKTCSSCDSIVMIADNWAPIKDLSLLSSYHKPVKVIVCGVIDKINKDYLRLARDTKGSIHLIEEDIYSLSELKEGETIRIHGSMYKLVGGEFIDMTTKSL